MNRLKELFINVSEEAFENPGWMEEFFDDILRKNQYVVSVDEDDNLTTMLTYWKFGEKRWGFIRKCTYRDLEHCPKQMGKGKHLYIPVFWIRPDRRGQVTVKKFIDTLKQLCPDATTLSWHDETGRFVTYKLIRRKDNGNIRS